MVYQTLIFIHHHVNQKTKSYRIKVQQIRLTTQTRINPKTNSHEEVIHQSHRNQFNNNGVFPNQWQ